MGVNKDGGRGQVDYFTEHPLMETWSQGNEDFLLIIDFILLCSSISLHIMDFVFWRSVLPARGQVSRRKDRHIFWSSLYPWHLAWCVAHRRYSISLCYKISSPLLETGFQFWDIPFLFSHPTSLVPQTKQIVSYLRTFTWALPTFSWFLGQFLFPLDVSLKRL